MTSTVHHQDDQITLHLGDCLDVLPTLPDASIDAIVCDPPYGLEFMGKEWDAPWKTGNGFRRAANEADVGRDNAFGRASRTSPEYVAGRGFQAWCEQWAAECLRVLKPGGHLLAFGGTRTYHRLACAIEDAGFEIRDSIHWAFGSGFPKGQDIGKAIDRRRDDRADVLRVCAWLRAARDAAGWTSARIDALFGFNGMASHWAAREGKAAIVPTLEQWATLRGALGFDDAEILSLVKELNARKGEIGEDWERREVVGKRHSGLDQGATSVFLSGTMGRDADGMIPVTVAASQAAKRWEGWSTSLKPAHEPIVVARKSTGFNTTVANVLEHGTGALNVDGCRVPAGRDYREKCASVVGIGSPRNGDTLGEWTGVREDSAHEAGRWPANLLLCHGPECVEGGVCQPGCPVAEMDRQSRVSASRAGKPRSGRAGGGWSMTHTGAEYDDEGGASRFFPVFRYEAKAPACERPRLEDGTAHATVKPLELMRWLVRLVTPPGGTVLDPFAGSGTTLEAAILEGFTAIGIEREQPYADLCVARLRKPLQPTLFGEAA